MIGEIFHTILYQPLYNGLVFLVSVIPGANVGVAIVALTLIVKIALFPFTHKSVKTQAKIKSLEGDVEKLKAEHKDDKQEQARKVMELYREHGVNPFSGCLLFLVQLPVLIALYWIFWRGLANGGFDPSLLYSFVSLPLDANLVFLGFIDMSGRSVILALLAGLTQFVQMKYAAPSFGPKPQKKGGKASLKDEFMQSMQVQMRYGLPVFVAIISYTISAAVALYWTTSNLFTISHELWVRRKAKSLRENQEAGSKN